MTRKEVKELLVLEAQATGKLLVGSLDPLTAAFIDAVRPAVKPLAKQLLKAMRLLSNAPLIHRLECECWYCEARRQFLSEFEGKKDKRGNK